MGTWAHHRKNRRQAQEEKQKAALIDLLQEIGESVDVIESSADKALKHSDWEQVIFTTYIKELKDLFPLSKEADDGGKAMLIQHLLHTSNCRFWIGFRKKILEGIKGSLKTLPELLSLIFNVPNTSDPIYQVELEKSFVQRFEGGNSRVSNHCWWTGSEILQTSWVW